jgi:5-methylcytosine-specific restriction enzyme subunit McrC
MAIPVDNVYYLLCYAWDLWADGAPQDVGTEPGQPAPELFVRVLVGAVERLFKRGADRGYVFLAEDSRSVRGKLAVTETVKRQLLRLPAVRCETDDLRHDVAHNRLIKATLGRLARCRDLSAPLRQSCSQLYLRLHDVADVPLTAASFDRVQFHRNARHYRLPIHICRVLFQSLMVYEQTGTTVFRDVLRDAELMPRIFEAFVRNFYRREQSAYPRVGGRRFDWQEVEASDADRDLLPQMRTDVCLDAPGRTLVIDAKFYADALTSYYDARSLHAANLYQLFAYLANLERLSPPDHELAGLLLYPTTGRELDLNYGLLGRRVRIATVDLSRPWPAIHARLLALLDLPVQENR